MGVRSSPLTLTNKLFLAIVKEKPLKHKAMYRVEGHTLILAHNAILQTAIAKSVLEVDMQ